MSKVKGKVFKSYAERITEPRKVYHKNIVSNYDITTSEDVVVDGRILKRSVIKTVHPQDKMRGLKPTDFALENIIAVGALDSLKEGSYSIGISAELDDKMSGTIDNIIKAVDSEESAQNKGGE